MFQYDWRRDTWSTLPDCPVKWFGMAQFLGKLITVGGKDRQRSVTGKVFQFNGQRWEEFSNQCQLLGMGLTVATRTSSALPNHQPLLHVGGMVLISSTQHCGGVLSCILPVAHS